MTHLGLSQDYIQATEWNLATLEEMACLKGTSKSRIDRQRSICQSMLMVAKPLVEANRDMESVWRKKAYRVYTLIEAAGLGFSDALDNMITKCRG